MMMKDGNMSLHLFQGAITMWIEFNYSSYKRESLAMVWAIAHFHHYLYGQQFTLVTNHQPLKWLVELNKLIGKLSR